MWKDRKATLYRRKKVQDYRVYTSLFICIQTHLVQNKQSALSGANSRIFYISFSALLCLLLPMEMFNLSVRKLANRIGISEGYATVLLLSNDWDEASIVEEWNQADNDLATRSGIVVSAEYLTTEGFCDSCETHTTCKTYGCSHLLCRICVKDYVEQNIRSGSLNVKCLISECNKNMSCSRYLDDVSLDCKNSFNAALAENYTLSKSKNAVQNPIASLKGLVAYLRANKWNFVSRAATFLQSNMWTLLASLLFAILVCQQFCGGITFTCVGVYSALCLVARYVCWGHMMKLIFAFFFYKLVTTNSVFTAAAFSSAATLVLIFAAIVGLVRRCFQIVMRIFRYIFSAYVSSVFRVAGNSDFAWEKFIPSVCGRLISSSTHLSLSSKKELYRCLCESILIDNGRKIFKIEKLTRKITYVLSARDRSITWGDQRHYWSWSHRSDSKSTLKKFKLYYK